MTLEKLFYTILFSGLTIILALGVGLTIKAQEAGRLTKVWQLGELPNKPYEFAASRVDVFDTEGVCLYVARNTGEGIAITAVPKTQLPKGVGCQ